MKEMERMDAMDAVAEALGLAPETSNLMVIEEIKRVKAQASQFNRDRIALGYAICDAIGIDGSQMSDEAIVNQVKAVKAYGDDGERFSQQVAEALGVDWGTSRQSSLLEQIRQLKDHIQAEAVDRFERNVSTQIETMSEVPEIGPQPDTSELLQRIIATQAQMIIDLTERIK